MSRMLMSVFALLTGLLCFVPTLQADDSGFPVTRNGRATATIITAPDIDRPFDKGIRRAEVLDFIRVIGKMSGASLPALVDGASYSGGPQIHIGNTEFVQSLNLGTDSLALNGFRILTTQERGEPRLVITGRTTLGVAHGIYHILTKELGVIWGMPGPLFEEVPTCSTIVFQNLDITEQPDFYFRSVNRGRSADWVRRNRADWSGVEFMYQHRGHAIFNVLPPSRYGDHPEYYAFHRGRYRVPESDSDHRFHINPTHPDVVRITVEYCREFFRRYPNALGVSLCPSDDDTFDESPGSAALDMGLPVWRFSRQYGDSYGYLINAVAESLMISHPGKYVSTYAYWNTVYPPRRIEHFPPNVVVWLTQDSANHFDPAYRADDDMILSMWRQKCDNVCLYEYHGLGWYTPRAYPTVIARRLRHLHELGVKAYYTEMHSNLAHCGPTDYITMRLLWDVDTDVPAALNRWYTAMFHDVAPVMKEYYELLENTYADTTVHRGHWFLGYYGLWEQIRSWPAVPRRRAMALLDSALASANDPTVRQRVEFIRNSHLAGHYMCEAHEAAYQVDADSPTIEQDIRGVTDLAAQAINAFHEHLEANPHQSEAYFRWYKPYERWKWLKYDIASHIDSILSDRPGLMQRMVQEDPVLGEMNSIRQNVRMFGYMAGYRKLVRQRGMIPKYMIHQSETDQVRRVETETSQ